MLNDEVVREVDAMAHRMGTNRSSLINQILAEYVGYTTPERRINDVLSTIQQLLSPSRELVPFFAPNSFSMSLKSSLEYKYRPTVKYEVELYRGGGESIGELTVVFRTQSAALIQAMTEFFRAQLEIYFIEHKSEADRVMEQVLINKRSRETAEKARLNIKKKLTGNVDLANRVQKFVDCRSKDVSRREIYIVEGDSALGACKLSRDAEFQGIMPVRGKILNCLKADYARIFKSDVITDLMRVLGCGVEVQSKQAKDLSAFNLENLRWNKVIICTDADVDGFQIRTLILTMLYRLAPTLIREGYVYIAESPLYEIVSKGKTYFAYSDREKAAIVDSLGGAKADINRSKGLGENDPEMMWLTTMNPDTRKLIRVMPEDVERTAQMFDLLLGDNLAGRKAHIAECGSQFLDLADIS